MKRFAELKDNQSKYKLKTIFWGCIAFFSIHNVITSYTGKADKMVLYYDLIWFITCFLISFIFAIKYFIIVRKIKKIEPPFKPFTLVKFDYESLPKNYWEQYRYNFPKNETLVYFGEIDQMPGHCIVCDFKTGKFFCGFHTDNFKPLTEDEI